MKSFRELGVWQAGMELSRKSIDFRDQFEIAARFGYIESDQLNYILQKCSSLGKQLYALRNGLARAPSRPIPVA